MFQMIDEWWKSSSSHEKVVAHIIGFTLGDFINDLIYKVFSIDSFVITTCVGIFSLFLTFTGFQFLKKARK